jgi:putative lipoprotein
VKADNAAAAQLFMKLYHEQLISVAGGMVVVTQEATHQLPNGHYYLTFRIFNDDHEALLENVFKVVVTDDELPLS